MNTNELRKRYEELRGAREREEAAVVEKIARVAKVLRELVRAESGDRDELQAELAGLDAELRAAPGHIRKLLKEEVVAHIELTLARAYATDRAEARAMALRRYIRSLYGVDISNAVSRRRVEQQLESGGYLDRQTARIEELIEQVL